MTINVTAVNDAPASADSEITGQQDQIFSFSVGDFPFSDIDGDPLSEVQITSLTDKGELQLNGTPVTAGQTIPAVQIGQLTFTPAPGEFGLPYTSFGFKVSDGQDFSDQVYTMVINVEEGSPTGEESLDAVVQVSPNPASEYLRLKVEAAQTLEGVDLQIFDESGKVVFSQALPQSSSTFQQEITVGGYAAGVYWLKIQSGNRVKAVRWVKR
jgi:hypothetical protein